MSHGHPINLPLKIDLHGNSGERGEPHHEPQTERESTPPGLKQNAAQLFDHQWQNSQANGRKNNLLTILVGSEHAPEHGSARTPEPRPAQIIEHAAEHFTERANDHQLEKNVEHIEKNTEHFVERDTERSVEHVSQNDGERQNFTSKLPETTNQINKTLDDLINLAREHKDFGNFQNRAEDFWQNVSRMSEIKIFRMPDGEPRVVSRYGELFDRLTREGGQIERFLTTLPAAEKEVFAARYQMEKTFGAAKFFVGGGIIADAEGKFPLRQFLTNNGKSVQLPLEAVLTLRESGLFGEENQLFANNQFLFSANTASLLGLSLAFYQNANALMSLEDAVLFVVTQNFAADGKSNLSSAAALKTDAAATRRSAESNLVGALINGALFGADERRKLRRDSKVEAWTEGAGANGFGFAAGAAGAMLGAAIGCLVPMAENLAGTALSFAASVVVGSTERGLRSLSATTLVSDVLTSGAQILLNASQTSLNSAAENSFLPGANSTIEDLKFAILNRRRDALLTA